MVRQGDAPCTNWHFLCAGGLVRLFAPRRSNRHWTLILLIPLRRRAGKGERNFANLRGCPVERTQLRSIERTPPQASTEWGDATNGRPGRGIEMDLKERVTGTRGEITMMMDDADSPR